MKLVVPILIALVAIMLVIPLVKMLFGTAWLVIQLLIGIAILIFIAGIVIRLINGATRH
jgi:hypothetical protein